MKKFWLVLLFISLFTVNSCSQNGSTSSGIIDIIAPVNLTAGIPDTVLVSDLFYSDNYDLEFSSTANLKTIYLNKQNMLILSADKNFSGLTTCSFVLKNKEYHFPVRVKKIDSHIFTFTPKKNYKKITLFGEFNNWNRDDIEFYDKKGDGIYEASVQLEPGIYQYKIFADGEEIIDPSNPLQVPNGIGGINSVVKIEGTDTVKRFLHVGNYNDYNEFITVSFYFENNSNDNLLKLNNLIFLLNNNKIKNEDLSLQKNKITVSIKKKNLIGRNVLRAAVSKYGQYTNIQYIILDDGKPINNKSEFSWNDAIIYSIMIDRFNNGDKSIDQPVVHDSLFAKANYMGGDFQGIINKLSEGYFDSLGVNVLWISPVNDNPDSAYRESPAPHRWFTGYHGYWPISSTGVEEHFGTMEKLKELINTAHDHNIKILLDFVSHHVFKSHPYVSAHPDWFGKLKLPDGTLNLRRWDDHRLTTWFEPYLPSFNFLDSKTARDSISENAIWWLKTTGADGFRHDAVKHVPNIFWRKLTNKIRTQIENPNKVKVYQIGETFGDYKLVSSYVNNGQLSSQFNFNLYNIAQEAFINGKYSFNNLNNEIEKSLEIYGPLNLMGNIMDSHDKNRFMAYADGDLNLNQWDAIEKGWNNPPKVDHPDSYQKSALYFAYMNSIPGLPVIYYGSEFGMTGASDPDNRRMMRFGKQLNKLEVSLLNEVSKITRLRRLHSALRYGDYYNLVADINFLVYLRSDLNEKIIVVINKNRGQKNLTIKLPAYLSENSIVDLISGEKAEINNNIINVDIKGLGYRFFICK